MVLSAKKTVDGIMNSIDENSRFFINGVGQISDFKINENENPGKPTRSLRNRPHLRNKHNVMDEDFENEWCGGGTCDGQWNVKLSGGTVEIHYHAGGPNGFGNIFRAIEVGKHPIITSDYVGHGRGREFVKELGSRINGKIKEDQERRVAEEAEAVAKKKKAEAVAKKKRIARRRAQRIQRQRETAEVEQLREFARRKVVEKEEQEQSVTKEELVELLKQQGKIIEQQNKKFEEISLEMKKISLEMKNISLEMKKLARR